MPQLEVGSMDQVKTGYEVLPEEKKVKVKVLHEHSIWRPDSICRKSGLYP